MLSFSEKLPAVEVPEAEYQRLLGFPADRQLEGRSQELVELTRRWYAAHGRPWIYAIDTGEVELRSEQLQLGGVTFSSAPLHRRFATAQVDRAMLVAVSAGPECEGKAQELWQEGKPDEYFFMEAYGSAVVEQLIAAANYRICAQVEPAGFMALPHYSPGYSGWDVADQIRLWELFSRAGLHLLPGALEVFDTGMLRPKKSLLAVVGLTANRAQAAEWSGSVACENCCLSGCTFRRAAYRRARSNGELPLKSSAIRSQPKAEPGPDTHESHDQTL